MGLAWIAAWWLDALIDQQVPGWRFELTLPD
jgi:hypothetical protein